MVDATGSPDEFGFQLVEVPSTADTPTAVIRFLLEKLVAAGRLPGSEVEEVARQLLRREHLGSTGIGRGLAIPHTTSESIAHAAIVGGLITSHVDWPSVDGKPISVVYLLVAPGNCMHDSLRALELLMRRLRGNYPEQFE